ncbi:uncharacterized protein YpiB (UPF0302 family) [Natronobacillus azotifigens]|uniref:IDEAL domain-containing protein n=1 Tax=Natronobacillus azotifigens TaxID=472978 RepID=A0A9J6R9W6_9BACI|nr:IDEAL domain-containing protein [Natronobacillus azotifigens]MCZ0702057.1 IDEAL domain-containing protein [Natronobacillus azotifigens]
MKKHKVNYRLKRYNLVPHHKIKAKREVSFEIQLMAQLLMDQLVSERNKMEFDRKINEAIESKDKELFMQLSNHYQHYLFEY